MGPSGSGKTTLLKLLAGRKLDHGGGGGDGAAGSILYNGLPCSKSLKRR
jgi:ABC-type Fe3+/spermidine/putrescine transport system ATPase subunit